MNTRRYRAACTLAAAAVLMLSGCNTDWEHLFSTHDNSGSADSTVDIDETDIVGLNVVASDANFNDTYTSLLNAIAGQTSRVVVLDLQARANRTSFGNESGTAIDGSNGSTGAVGQTGVGTSGPGVTSTGGTSTTGAVGQTGTGTSGPGVTSTGGTNTTGAVGQTGTGASGPGVTSTGGTNTTGAVGQTGVDTGTGSTATASNGMTSNTITGSTDSNNDSVDVRPTRLILFDNPSRSTPVLQDDAQAGLDLPVSMLVYQDDSGDAGIAYNNESYLKSRYDVGDADDALDAIADNLKTLAQDASGNSVEDNSDNTSSTSSTTLTTGSSAATSEHQGIIAHGSSNDFTTTLTRLRSAIDADSSLDYIVQIDHQAAANSVGQNLNPSVLVLFDARADDADLLSANQTVGINLPQRILVTQDDNGDVHLYYNDPSYVADRHKIDDRDDQVEHLSETLSDLVDSARRSSN